MLVYRPSRSRVVVLCLFGALVAFSWTTISANNVSFLPDHIFEIPVDYDANVIGFHVGKLDALGFHGDKYLIRGVDVIAPEVIQFVETGTHAASTLHFMTRTYHHIKRLLSCEPNEKYHSIATTHMGLGIGDADISVTRMPRDIVASWRSRVDILRSTSQDMLRVIAKSRSNMFDAPTLFWFDAHGSDYFEWPLREEIGFVAKRWKADAFVFIDDFKVPSEPSFGFDVVDGQECSYDYVKDAIPPDVSYRVYYPSYTQQTSTFCPLRGWALIHFPAREDRAPRRFDIERPDIFLLGHQSSTPAFCAGIPPSLHILEPGHGSTVAISGDADGDSGRLTVKILYDCFAVGRLCLSMNAFVGATSYEVAVPQQCMGDLNEFSSVSQNGHLVTFELQGVRPNTKYGLNIFLEDPTGTRNAPKRFAIFETSWLSVSS